MAKYAVVGADEIGFAVAKDGNVVMKIHGLADQLGLADDFQLAIALTPDEARQAAQALLRTAALAEGG